MKALARTLIVLLAMAWSSSTAVALDIRFDDVTSVGNPLVTELETHGYRFTGVFRTIDTPGTVSVTNGSAVYLGQEPGAPGLTVSRSDGGPFALSEFDAAGPHLVPPAGSPNAQQVAVLGLRIDGTLLEASFTLSELPAFAHFWVPSSWHDLRIVTFTGLLSSGGPGALAIDDVGVGEGPTSVSEPGTLALVLITGLGGGAAVLTRHRGHATLWRR